MPANPLTRLSRLALALALAVPPVGAVGCGLLPGTATSVPSDPVSQQRALDSAREKYGLALDIVGPLVSANVITDAQSLATIRTIVKQVEADIPAAQKLLDAGNTVTAGFVVDRIAAAATTVTRIGDTYKGRKP